MRRNSWRLQADCIDSVKKNKNKQADLRGNAELARPTFDKWFLSVTSHSSRRFHSPPSFNYSFSHPKSMRQCAIVPRDSVAYIPLVEATFPSALPQSHLFNNVPVACTFMIQCAPSPKGTLCIHYRTIVIYTFFCCFGLYCCCCCCCWCCLSCCFTCLLNYGHSAWMINLMQ